MTDEVRWIREWSLDGRPSYRIGRVGDDLVAEWSGFARLRATRAGEVRELTLIGDLDRDVAEKFCVGLMQAMLRHARGETTFHGSSVARSGRALVLVGESGAGKSTLAAELCARDGVELLADDSAAIDLRSDEVRVVATERVCWLTGDALVRAGLSDDRAQKLPWTPRACASAHASLRAIVVLAFDANASAPELVRVTGSAAFVPLSQAVFRLVIDEDEAIVGDFERLARIVAAVPVYELRRPRDIAMLGGSADRLLDLLSRGDRE